MEQVVSPVSDLWVTGPLFVRRGGCAEREAREGWVGPAASLEFVLWSRGFVPEAQTLQALKQSRDMVGWSGCHSEEGLAAAGALAGWGQEAGVRTQARDPLLGPERRRTPKDIVVTVILV